MKEIKPTIQKVLELAGFNDFSVDFDEKNRKLTIFINEGEWFKEWIPRLVSDFTHIVRVLNRRSESGSIFIDVNNYRGERENIIADLAKAAARKVNMTKGKVRLPAMNSYERRLIHMELAARPDIETESEGEGVERCVVIKPLD